MTSFNILHMISSDRWTGAAEPVTNLVAALRDRGHRVQMGLIRGHSFETHARSLGIPLVESFNLHRGFNPLKDWADARLLRRLVKDEGIDLIHCHMNKDHWLAGMTRRLFGLPCPLVRTQHRVMNVNRRAIGKRWLFGRVTDATIVLGEALLRGDRVASSLPAGKVHVIPGAVDTRVHTPDISGAAVREALDIPIDAPTVGMIAHFKAGRGWHTAIPAMAQLHARRPSAHFILAGGHSRLVKWVRAQMTDAGCLDRTHIITDQRFPWPEVLAAMDMSIWLAPGSEATARAVLEVMATGRPVIASDVGPIPEIITDGENGCIVPNGVGVNQLAETITALIEDISKCRAMGAAARKTIEQRFTLERQVSDIEALYASLISDASATRGA